MKYLILLVALALSFPAIAQDKKAPEKKAPEKKAAKKATAKKAEPKASNQEWGRWSSSGHKTLNEKEQQGKKDNKDAAKKK